jgi:aryl-alcohol dehydrogenase-like predicted oxidoreductase
LQTDYIDLYLIHQADTSAHTPIDETLRAMDDLVRQGKVRYIGCCNLAAWEVCKALWVSDRLHLTPFVGVQNHYNLLDREPERELMPFCRSEGLGMMTYSALAVGLLTGRFRRGTSPPADSPWTQNQERFEQMLSPEADQVIEAAIRIGAERGKTPAQVAIAWLLSHPEISAAMIGPDSPEQLDEAIGAIGWELSAEERASLDEVSTWAVNTGKR